MKLTFGEGSYQIRSLIKSDADALAKYGSNRDVWLSLRDQFPYPYSKRDARQFIAAVALDIPQTTFAISDETELIGSIGLKVGADIHRVQAEVGYWLGEPFWGKNIMTQALELFTAYAFDELGLARLYAEPLSKNVASIRVLQKAGFHREGTKRFSALKDGELQDQELYARVNENVFIGELSRNA